MARKPRSQVSGEPTQGPPESLELPDPLVFPADVLAPVPPGMGVDHLLLERIRNDDIVLSVRCPANAIDRDTLQLLVDGSTVGGEVLLDPYIPDFDDVPLVLPASVRNEGWHRINYKMIFRSGSGLENYGPPGQQFIADYTAPGGATLPPFQFSAEVIADGVTPDTLSVGPGGEEYLAATVIPYFEKAWGDLVQALLDGAPVGAPVEVPEDTDPDLELAFPRAALEAAGDGSHSFAFLVTDRAGNQSDPSLPELLPVRLGSSIPDLLPPIVPGAADGLVTDSDARVNGGVTIHIPGHASIQTGDTVVWSWNAHVSAPIPVTQGGQDPLLTVTAAYGDVYGDWLAASGDTNSTVPATVTYTVARAGVDLGSPPVPARPPVNLFGPGGEDPDPDTPEHENLRAPSVQAAGGGPVNSIPADAIDEDAVATIPGMTAGVPPVPAFRPGDSVQFYWNGQPVDAPFVVTVSGSDVLRTVPGDVLAAHAPGTWNVHYVATRALVLPPFENAARSPDQAVEIMDAGDLPGGGDPLPAAKWVEGPAGPGDPDHIDYDKAISDGGTPLRIYAYANMAIGDRISVQFQGYNNTNPSQGQPIPESAYAFIHDVTADDLAPKPDDAVTPPVDAVYVDILIPTAPLLAIGYGSAHFDYTVTNAAGSAEGAQAFIYMATQH